MGPTKLLIVDLEATCWQRSEHVQEEMETIEIGARVVDPSGAEPARDFQCFVRPLRRPTLSAFCTQLTSIRQSDVDPALSFGPALAAFLEWLGDPREVRFGSWGAYDRRQIARDCAWAGVADPFGDDPLNLKHLCCARLGLRPTGMAQALARAGLGLEGTHHRALDDVRNIARLVAHTFPDDLALLLASPPAPRS